MFSVFRLMTLTSSPSLLSTYSRTFCADAHVAISKHKKRKRKADQIVLCRMPHPRIEDHSNSFFLDIPFQDERNEEFFANYLQVPFILTV